MKLSRIVLDSSLDSSSEASSQTRTLDFEHVTGAPIVKVPNGVAQLEWRNLIVVLNDLYGGPGYVNGTVSGRYVAYNSSGYPVEVARDRGFDFLGAYFTVAWPEAEGESLRVQAWRGDELIGDETIYLSVLVPVWFDAQYHAITRMLLSTGHFWQFVTDNWVVGES